MKLDIGDGGTAASAAGSYTVFYVRASMQAWPVFNRSQSLRPCTEGKC